MSGLRHQYGLSLHLEPENPIMLDKLLDSLRGVEREYVDYAREVWDVPAGNKTKLFVGSVRPGSIDIILQPEFIEAAKLGLAVAASAGPIDATKALLDFAKHFSKLLGKFDKPADPHSVSIRDCDNAANIVKPVIQAGGVLNVNVIENVIVHAVDQVDFRRAQRITRNAEHAKAQLLLPQEERHYGVPLIWKTVDRSPPKTEGVRAPDKAVIPPLDERAHSVTFGENTAVKQAIVAGDENPMQMIYYVDIAVIRIDGKIKAYRVDALQSAEPVADDE